MKFKFLRRIWIATFALAVGALTACGGGGGGGGDGGGGGGTTPLNYSGNTNPAVITANNAGAITANVVSTGDASSAGAVSTLSAAPPIASDSGMVDLGRQLHRTVRRTFAQPGPLDPRTRAITRAITIDERFPCDSGEIHVSGTVSDNGIGTVTVRYINCRTGGTTANGNATMRIDAFDVGFFGPTDYTITFVRLTLTGAAAGEISGSLRSRLDIPTRTETFTENVIVLFPSGVMTMSQNLVYVDVYNDLFNPTSYTESVSGRIFHSVHGYVQISTPVPLFFGSLSQEFPQNGQLLLTGANAISILVTALSPTLLNLGLDLDGNGTFEETVMLTWSDLSGPVGGNLADTDGDGMHDGWESANGFNPNDAADALADADGDGASNHAEYAAGTNPRDAGSQPPSVGLSIQATSDAPDPASVGGSLTYTFTVSNSGSTAATNVVVTDPLPAGVSFVSAVAAQGSCAGTATVVCSLGTVNGFTSVTVTVVVSPTATGSLSNTATVSTSSFDPFTADNSATSVTLVGLPAAGIQGRIDTASPGDTIIVDPGTYSGPLNFGGKDITLRSRDGAGTTIIHGNGGTGEPVIRMGPGGALIGFTITGGTNTFGGGVQLLASTGSLISGNVFEGNSGFQAAIGGNSASATIERNVFRNNSCDNQHLSGVVGFINSSSPRIINNVFVDNPCRAINMTLPQFNTPEVVNNTFVRNRTGIYVDTRVPQTTQVYRNNIIVQNDIGFEIAFGSNAADNPAWTNNLVFGNTTNYSGTADLTGTNGNISVDPLFVNQAGGDFHLNGGSPAISAGTSTNAPAADFDGVPRTVPDIGAFEGP